MARPRKITDETKLLIAMRSAEQGMSNKAISESLRISESAVSKALHECFEEGRLQLVFNRDGLTDQQLAALKDAASDADELSRLLADLAKDSSAVVQEPELRIFDSGSAESSASGWRARLETFGRAAAPYIRSQLAAAHTVGTSWGETLAAIVRGLGAQPAAPPKHPIQFVPLCGEMLEGPPRKVSASNLAYQLDEIVNGDLRHTHSHWLAGVPSRFPMPGTREPLDPDECDAVSRYIKGLRGYRNVFGSGSARAARGAGAPLIERLDMVLTSCGPKERPLGYSGVRDLQSAGLSLRRAAALVVGDLSGILLRNPELDRKASAPVDRINAAWTGATLGHLRECSRRALAAGSGGVVLCALGANKAETVLEIVRLGLATRILVDFDLARQLRLKLA